MIPDLLGFAKTAMKFLGVDYLSVDDLGSGDANCVYFTYPFHWILRFELFGYVFFFGKLTDKQIVHIVCLRINVSEICRELTRGEQIEID